MKFKRDIVITVLIIAVLATTLGVMLYKPPLNTITYENLLEIDGIGEVLASRILIYLEDNKNATTDDLINVNGIGEIKLKRLKGKYR